MDFIILIPSTSPRAETFRRHLAAYSARWVKEASPSLEQGAQKASFSLQHGALSLPASGQEGEDRGMGQSNPRSFTGHQDY